MTMPGKFITLEGIDGAGKSTHLSWLAQELQSYGLEVVMTREPGGTKLGEELRELLLNQSMALETETLLIFAARNEHLCQVIEPALKRGAWVVCDRFTDATYAYQGGGRQFSVARIVALEQSILPPRQPDRTWLFDVPLEEARRRLNADARRLDRFEGEGAAFFARTRNAYLARAHTDPQRIHIIDGLRGIADIRAQLKREIATLVRAAHYTDRNLHCAP